MRFLNIFFPLIFCNFSCSSSCNEHNHPQPIPRPAKTSTPIKPLLIDSGLPTTDGGAPVTIIHKPNMGGSSGWLTFRGSPQRHGRADICGPRTANLKWVFRTRGRVYADVAVTKDGKTIYVASHDHHLYAIDAEGRERWSFDAGGKIWTSPTISSEGNIYVGTDADFLYALNPDGKKIWEFCTTKPPIKGDKPEAGRYDVDTAPAILNDGTVVFGCHTDLYALRPFKGGLRWVFEAGVGRSKIFSSPALGYDQTIYIGTQGNYLFALNQSAKPLWHKKTNGDNDSTPAVGDDGTIYFASDDGYLRALAWGGKLRWKTKVGAPMRAPLAIGHDGTIYASTYGAEPYLAAYDQTSGTEKWRFKIKPGKGSFYGIQSGALIDSKGYIYFGGRDHFIYCLSPNGQLVWKYKTSDQIDSSPVLGSDGTLYIGSDDKRVYAFGE